MPVGSPSGIRLQGDRQARTSDLPAAISLQPSPDSGSFCASGFGTQVKLVRVPERVMIQHCGMKIADLSLCAGQNIRCRKKNEGQVFRDELLDPIVNPLSLLIV